MIGIMGAMLQEVAHLKEAMQDIKEHQIGGRTYYEGKLYGQDAILVFSRWGKVASSSTATTLIAKFGINSLIFTGVAGAVSEKLNIGDVVIGNKLYQHDMDTRPIFPQYEIPLTGQTFFTPADADLTRAQAAAGKFTAEISAHIDKAVLTKFSIFKPTVHVGTIASGDQFIADPDQHENLHIKDEDVLAVEMEGASVAQVCSEHEIPFTVIRTISDKAKHDAHIDFQAFVDEVASHYSQGIIRNMF